MNNVMIGIMMIEMVVLIIVNLKKVISVKLYLIQSFIFLFRWQNVLNVLKIVKSVVKTNVKFAKVVTL